MPCLWASNEPINIKNDQANQHQSSSKDPTIWNLQGLDGRIQTSSYSLRFLDVILTNLISPIAPPPKPCTARNSGSHSPYKNCESGKWAWLLVYCLLYLTSSLVPSCGYRRCLESDVQRPFKFKKRCAGLPSRSFSNLAKHQEGYLDSQMQNHQYLHH